MVDPVRTASIRTLFQQVPNSFAAAAVVTLYMAATAAPTSPIRLVVAWLAVQIGTQLYRAWLLARYRRIPDEEDGARLERAARANSLYMLMAGLVWGSTAFLFMRADAPITVALTLCGLYGIAAGSVAGNAYNPSGLYLFVWTIFVAVMARMIVFGDYGHIVLGIASLCFAGIMTMFCRVQTRAIREGFAIRFENRRLLAALEIEKAEADAARARAEQSHLAKSQLLAAASHDLRQPLHALGMFSESLRSLSLDAAALEVVGRIQANVAAMETLFNGLLDISRLEAGVVRSQIGPVSLSEMFDRLSAYFEPSAEAKGLKLRFRDTAIWAASDAALLEQIVVNLITNAVRYTEFGGILVAARRRAGAVSIEVYDTGVGVLQKDEARIFEEFVQIGNAERDRDKGLGLGLSIAQRLAGLLGSQVMVRSILGRGSRFSIAQPMAAAPPDAIRSAHVSADLIGGMRILLIDDDKSVRESANLLLRQWGAQVALAGDAGAAKRLIAESEPFDVCVCDYRLPDQVNGLDLIGALRSEPRSPRAVCLLTGDMAPEVLAAADAAGVLVVHKPLQPARLRALLNHLSVGQRADPDMAALS